MSNEGYGLKNYVPTLNAQDLLPHATYQDGSCLVGAGGHFLPAGSRVAFFWASRVGLCKLRWF